MPNDGRAIHISGFGVYSGLGQTYPGLIRALEQGAVAEATPFFGDDREAVAASLPFNPPYIDVPMAEAPRHRRRLNSAGRTLARLCGVIDEALAQAGLEAEHLAGQRVRVYLGGPGVHPEIARFIGYLTRDDPEDLAFYPGIREQHADNYRQEPVSRELVRRYRLSRPPVSLYTASCASLSALYLAANAIGSDQADLAVVASWQPVHLTELFFLGGLNALSPTGSQPFSQSGDGVLPGAAAAALVLESEAHLKQRKARGLARLEAVTTCQSSSARGGSPFAPDFRTIANTMTDAIRQAGLTEAQVDCVFPHGNGLRSSDKAEAMSIQKVWGEREVPVVSYKSQLGYLLAASGLVDLAILVDSLNKRRLLGFSASTPLESSYGLDFHTGSQPRPLGGGGRGLKVGLGIDGSVVACVVSAAHSPTGGTPQ